MEDYEIINARYKRTMDLVLKKFEEHKLNLLEYQEISKFLLDAWKLELEGRVKFRLTGITED